MTYSFHPEAEIEFNNAIDYYEDSKKGLGLEFAVEVYNTINQRIIPYPNAWHKIDKNIRRCLTNRFPFGIIYYQKNNQIIILAVMHLHKKPNYWKNRK
jgi:hypothetical protein